MPELGCPGVVVQRWQTERNPNDTGMGQEYDLEWTTSHRRVELLRLRKRNCPHRTGHAGGRVQAGTQPASPRVGHPDSTDFRGMSFLRKHLGFDFQS